ncbi:zinc-dependent metalloprotease family protein [Thalassotalea sp. Y01]|uniref:zinc-dependent metalloprotease family protein n=1 Tax=Thalassotalea sp. Y01 TaxID=2729613 RepID=UPI00145E2633|nr:zinc-dependent metalloprotease family protein [Thalassotalea sp. Y01]NMP16383.1 hypothetical protein [Thalassotalea sp. Y01]
MWLKTILLILSGIFLVLCSFALSKNSYATPAQLEQQQSTQTSELPTTQTTNLWQFAARNKQPDHLQIDDSELINEQDIIINFNIQALTALLVGQQIRLQVNQQRHITLTVDSKKHSEKHGKQTLFLSASDHHEHTPTTLFLSHHDTASQGWLRTPTQSLRLLAQNGEGKLFAIHSMHNDADDIRPHKYLHSDDLHDHDKARQIQNRIAANMSLTTPPPESEIAILMVYTDEVENYFSGQQDLHFSHLIEVANQTFSNSKVDIKLTLAASHKLSYQFDGDLQTALRDVTYNDLQQREKLEQIRYETAADLVFFIIGRRTSNVTGYAWVNGEYGVISEDIRSMYSVMHVNASDYVFAHEIGHNLGLRHSRMQWPYEGSTFDFALGHGVDKRFITVMAYNSDFKTSNRLAIFSNPELSCLGYPCGVDQSDQQHGADASFALNVIRDDVAQFYNEPVNLTRSETLLTSFQHAQLKGCIQANIASHYYIGMFNSLSCEAKQISNLDDLSNLFALRTLNLSYNQINDIETLGKLKHLVSLNLNNNQISDVSPLFNQQKRWLKLSLQNNPVYCWQVDYLQNFEDVYAIDLPVDCDDTTEYDDYDMDGTSNRDELNNNTNPALNALGAGVARFAIASYQFNGGAGDVSVKVERRDGNVGTLEVSVAVNDGDNNVVSNEVITLQQRTLSFAHGQLETTLDLHIGELQSSSKTYQLVLNSNDNSSSANVIISNEQVTSAEQSSSSSGGSGGSLYWLSASLGLLMVMVTRWRKASRKA